MQELTPGRHIHTHKNTQIHRQCEQIWFKVHYGRNEYLMKHKGGDEYIFWIKDTFLKTEILITTNTIFPDSFCPYLEFYCCFSYLESSEYCRWYMVSSSTGEAIYVCSVTQSCLTLCDPKNSSPPGSSVGGTFQARILEQVAISYSRRSISFRDWTHVSWIGCIGRQILYHFATWEAQLCEWWKPKDN